MAFDRIAQVLFSRKQGDAAAESAQSKQRAQPVIGAPDPPRPVQRSVQTEFLQAQHWIACESSV